MEITEIVESVLLKNGWAVMLKGNPIVNVPVQGESESMFKINIIETERFINEIKLELEAQTEIQEYNLWKKSIREGED